MSLAYVFPGQGSQHVGMGRELALAFPEAQAVFDAADAALGLSISSVCFRGPEEQLQLTANTQPAILATSIAVHAVMKSRGPVPEFVAGHSLGEYSALVAAGTLDFADAVGAVRRRGEYMQQAVPSGEGAMAAILMLDLAAIEAACHEAAQGEVVSPANINAPGQVVIAGHAAAVDRAILACKARGAKRVIKLPVSAPFHCALMRPAQERMANELAALTFRDPKPPLVNNADAKLLTTGAQSRDGLVRQVSSPVRWQQSVELLLQQGVTTFVEVGPGNVLSGLVKKIAKGAKVLNASDPATLETTLASLAAVSA